MYADHLLVVLGLLLLAGPLTAEQAGYLSGFVHDRSGISVPGAEIRTQDASSGVQSKIYCDQDGHFQSESLKPGSYTVTVRNRGFYTTTRTGIQVSSKRMSEVDLVIELLPMQQEISVEGSSDDSNPGATGLALKRGSFVRAFPANGRDLHALVTLMPGATITPASVGDGGQFTVGGQRPNTNSFRVDGVSGNAGIGVISVPGSFPGATLPGMTTIGSTQALVSKEEIKQIDLNSSNFAAELGDRPGAQIVMETRGGSNQFHGSAFGYLRPQMLSSKDWFSNSTGAEVAGSKWNSGGASLGGPIRKDRLFFFGTFERSNVFNSAVQTLAVPSAAARVRMPANYQQLISAFALPQGVPLNADTSVGISGVNKSGQSTNRAIRADGIIGRGLQAFVRYNSVPSSASSYELGTANSTFRWMSITGGLNWAASRTLQQLRFNFSEASAEAEHAASQRSDQPGIDAIGSALIGYLFPREFFPANLPGYSWNITQVSIAGVGQVTAGGTGLSYQRQREVSYLFAHNRGRHEIHLGFDYTALNPRNGSLYGALSLSSGGISELLAGAPLGVTISNLAGGRDTTKMSFFAQDNVRINQRLTLLYGLRWEVTPPLPTYAFDGSVFPYIGAWSGPGSVPTQVGFAQFVANQSWPFRYTQFAPRVGLAYRLAKPEIVFRAGFGTFYDTSLGSSINPVNINNLGNWIYYPGFAVANASSPGTAATPLALPRVYQWRASAEKSLAAGSTLSLAYFGASGSSLLRKQASVGGSGVLQSLVFGSEGRSSYHALQAQTRGQLTSRLSTLLSYTWAHSVDNGSSDTTTFLNRSDLSDRADRGSSSFDVRHNLTASALYTFPASRGTATVNRVLANWTLSATLQARSGFPFDVTTVDRSAGVGFDNTNRPDFVSGAPLWLADGNVPGGRRINSAAFSLPTSSTNGSLGRNVLTGSRLFQMDVSLRRQFRVAERLTLEAQASAFNLMNHPNFSNPIGYLGSPLFGQPTSMGNLMLGSGSPTTGLAPLFQAGGPRTVEFGLRVTF